MREKRKQIGRQMLNGLWAGAFIGIAGVAYLKVGGAIGSFLFSFGLIAILSTGMSLYTGIIGEVLRKKNPKTVVVVLFSNIVGTLIVAVATKFSGLNEIVANKAADTIAKKMEAPYMSIVIMSFLCGTVVHLGVFAYKSCNDIRGIIILIAAVMLFVNVGFEHCIANTFYLWFAFQPEYITKILLMIVGNSLGAIALEHSSEKIKQYREREG